MNACLKSGIGLQSLVVIVQIALVFGSKENRLGSLRRCSRRDEREEVDRSGGGDRV